MKRLTNNSRVYCSLIVFCIVVAVCGSVTAQVQVPRVATLPTRNKQLVAKPRVLTQIKKIQAAQKILSGSGQKVSSMESPIVLDLFHLFVKDRAYLVFHMPSEIDSVDNTVEFAPQPKANPSYAQVAVPVPPPGIYLIDISVSYPGSSPKFSLSTPNGLELKTLSGFDNQHLLTVAIVKPGDVFPISVVVSAPSIWYFHSCEISKVK